MRYWEEIERSMYEPQSYFRLRWGWLSGFRGGGGRMGAYGMLQSCWRCQYLQGLRVVPTVGTLLPTGTTGAAYWAPLLQRPQSIVGPLESASQWIIYVLTGTCQRLYDTLFRCTVGRFRVKTNIPTEWKRRSSALFCGSHELHFHSAKQTEPNPPPSLAASVRPTFSQSDWDAGDFAGRKQKDLPTLLYSTSLHLNTLPQPAKTEWSEGGCLLA